MEITQLKDSNSGWYKKYVFTHINMCYTMWTRIIILPRNNLASKKDIYKLNRI